VKTRRIVLWFLAVGAVLLALESARERFAVRAARRELDRTFENVAERVREGDRIYARAIELSDAIELAQVRSAAMIVESDPGCLTNQAKFAHICRQLEVDELCVVDEKGVVIAAEPASEIGYDLHSAEQSAAFLPAITNQDFVLSQNPMPRGRDRKLFQFVGIARRDKPGVVQIAVGDERIKRFGNLVSPDDVERTSRVGRGGSVKLEEVEEVVVNSCSGRGEDCLHSSTATSDYNFSRSEIVGSKRISVTLPAPIGILAGDFAFYGFSTLAVVLFLALFQAIVPSPRRMTRVQARACLFVVLSLVAMLLAAESNRRMKNVESVHARLLLALENATGRVRSATANVQVASRLVKHANLVKARACATLEPLASVWPTFDVDVRALAGLDDAVKPSVRSDGRFTEFVPIAEAADRKGYFVETRGDVPYVCLSARCGDYEAVVGAPSPEGILTYHAVWGSLLALAALLLFCAIGSLLPQQMAQAADYLKTFFAYFWGLRNERTKDVGKGLPFWKKLSNPIVIAILVMFAVTFSAAWTNWSNVLHVQMKEELAKQSKAIAGNVSDSVDNMLLAVSRAIVRHYRTPDNLTIRDADDLARRYDIDEVCVVQSNGVSSVANFGEEIFDMASTPETAKFNCLLHGAPSFVAPFRPSVEDVSVVRKYAGVPFPDAPGYVQIGIDLSRLTSDARYLFSDSIRGKRFGETGFPLWVEDETGEIVANGAPEARADDTLASIGFNSATAPEAGVPFKADFYGRRCYVVWAPYANLRVYAIQPCDEIDVWKAMRGPLILMSIAYFLFLKMALSLSAIVAQLKKFIVAEHERQKSDMTMARTIQTSALPIGFPVEDDFAINAKMETAREVGGDFYDYYAMPDGRIVFLIADVSGKGVPAALFMMRAKAIIRAAILESRNDLAQAVRLANDNLSYHNDAEMFVTAWIGVFDRGNGRVDFVNAGHNPPLVRRADGSVEWVRNRGGLVFGALPNIAYKSHTIFLERGDTLFLYTDGVTEAMSRAQQQFGEARLEQTLRNCSGGNPIAGVSRAIAKFTTGAEQSDDITMLTMERRLSYSPAEMPDLG